MKDRNTANAKFIQVNQWPQKDSHLTAKLYVDVSIDEPSLIRNNKDIDFNIHNISNKSSITLNTQAVNDNQVITKAYVDQFHNDNERNRRDLGLSFYDEEVDVYKRNNKDSDLKDNKLTNLVSITVNRNPSLDNELANTKFIDDELNKNTIVRFNQTLESYPILSVGNDTYDPPKNDKIQLTDTTKKAPNIGGFLLQQGNIKYNDKKNNGQIQNFY